MESYAALFAAKEAIVKAMGTGFRGIEFTDIEIFMMIGENLGCICMGFDRMIGVYLYPIVKPMPSPWQFGRNERRREIKKVIVCRGVSCGRKIGRCGKLCPNGRIFFWRKFDVLDSVRRDPM